MLFVRRVEEINIMMRIALVGLGRVAEQIHLPACAMIPNVKIIAACEPDRDRRRLMAKQFGISTQYETPEALFEKEKPDIAVIGTPPHFHRDHCLLAIENGAHVLCEKPFVQNLREADEVIEAADQKRLSVFVNNQYRYMKIYSYIQERIKSGDFGKPFLIQFWQQMFHPPSEEKNWRAGLQQYTLFEFGTHPIDLISYFFDDLPISISANTPHRHGDLKTDVVVQATLRFTGQRLATLMFNRISHAPERYLEMRIDCEKASFRISFGGLARLALTWSRISGRPVTRFSFVKGGEARMEAKGRSQLLVNERKEGRPRATAMLMEELIKSIKRGDVIKDRVRHARDIIQIVLAGYESAKSGETVWITKPK
jgi:predicted dehydrogenase